MPEVISETTLSYVYGMVPILLSLGFMRQSYVTMKKLEWDRIPRVGGSGLYYPRPVTLISLYVYTVLMLVFASYAVYIYVFQYTFSMPFNFFDLDTLTFTILAQLFFVVDLCFTQFERLMPYRVYPIALTLIIIAAALIRAFLFI